VSERNVVLRVGEEMSSLALRVLMLPIGVGLAVERQLRPLIRAALDEVVVGVVDAVLRSGAIDAVLERVEASEVSRSIARQMLADGIAEQIVQGALESGQLEAVFTKALDNDATREAFARALEGPAVERLLASGLGSPGSRRLLNQVLESELLEQTIAALLESPELWVMVDEIARSPAVTEAITHQSAGFIDQVAGNVRDSSRDADAWLERAARRVVPRRRAKSAAANEPAAENGAGRFSGENPDATPPSDVEPQAPANGKRAG